MRARSRLAQTAAGRRLRRARGAADRRQAASLRWCVASCLKLQLAIEDKADPVIECAGRRLAIPFADFWRPTAANYWGRVKKAHGLAIGKEILGDRWARDHADDRKPVLAAALETAFDPTKNAARIGLGQTARDTAAVWLPPGMAYGDRIDADDGQAGDGDPAATDLPAFLTADVPHAGHAQRSVTRQRVTDALTRIFGTETAHRRARGLRMFTRPLPLQPQAHWRNQPSCRALARRVSLYRLAKAS